MFADVLRRFRLRAGLTQEMLAERARVGVATIAALEQGLRHRPYPNTLAAIKEALGLNPSDAAMLLLSASEVPVRSRTTRHSPPPQHTPGHSVHSHGPAVELPAPATSLIGRDADTNALSTLLQRNQPAPRLVTLVGPGGVGKSRLALAVATAVAGTYPDGVVFVDLAPLQDHLLISATVAGALRVHAVGGQSACDLVFTYLQDRKMLLVLDNLEHLVSGARFLSDVLAACPRVTLLATSRTALRLRAERRVNVEPLPQPADDESSLDAIAASPAVQLFIDRAQKVTPEFTLEAHTAATVAAICRRLDGMPLAIELAAARVGLLGPEIMLKRLDRQLQLLTGGPADLPERQRTLSNTLAWSYDLLGPAEQVLLRRVAVFAGGWTLSAAESVCSNGTLASDDVLGRLEALVDSSLIRRLDVVEDEPRFGLLESVREYAAHKLVESGEYEALRERHATWCLALAEQAADELLGPAQARWMEHLDRALDNLRLTLAWLHEQQRTEIGLRLVGALGRFWFTRRYIAEGREWVERFLAAAGAETAPAAVRARACFAAGMMACLQGDYQHAIVRLEQSIEQYHLAGDRVGAARALITRAGTSYDQGQVEYAAELWSQALAQARQAGDLGEAAHALGNRGEVLCHLGDTEAAVAHHTEALALARRAGRTDVEAMQLGAWGRAARKQGDLSRATTLQRHAMVLKRELGARRQIAITLADLASIAGAEGRGQRAARLVGAATALRERTGTPQPLPERLDMESAVANVRVQMGEESWAAELQVGRAMSMDQAIDYSLE